MPQERRDLRTELQTLKEWCELLELLPGAGVITLPFKLDSRVHMLLCTDTSVTKMSQQPLKGEERGETRTLIHRNTLAVGKSRP